MPPDRRSIRVAEVMLIDGNAKKRSGLVGLLEELNAQEFEEKEVTDPEDDGDPNFIFTIEESGIAMTENELVTNIERVIVKLEKVTNSDRTTAQSFLSGVMSGGCHFSPQSDEIVGISKRRVS